VNIDPDLEALLPVDTVDDGCASSFDVLHRYVEDELAGGQPSLAQPGLAAHLRNCPACREDYQGLLDAADRFGDVGPTES
jgi:hypothetical protein